MPALGFQNEISLITRIEDHAAGIRRDPARRARSLPDRRHQPCLPEEDRPLGTHPRGALGNRGLRSAEHRRRAAPGQGRESVALGRGARAGRRRPRRLAHGAHVARRPLYEAGHRGQARGFLHQGGRRGVPRRVHVHAPDDHARRHGDGAPHERAAVHRAVSSDCDAAPSAGRFSPRSSPGSGRATATASTSRAFSRSRRCSSSFSSSSS